MFRKIICFVGIVSLLLVGCGIHNSAGDHVRKTEKSSATSGKRKQETDNDRFANANDRYAYCAEGNQIVQYILGGRQIQKFKVVEKKDIDSWWLAGVNNREVFYSIIREDEEKQEIQLWCIPIERKDGGERLLVDQAELVLTDTEEEFASVYADEDTIVYVGSRVHDYYSYNEYDRKTKKYRKVDTNSDRVYALPLNGDSVDLRNLNTAGILLTQYQEDDDGQFAGSGLYYHELGSETVTKVCDGYLTGIVYVASRNKIFYSNLYKSEEEMYDPSCYDIYVYDCRTGENRVFIKGEEWRKIVVDSGFPLDEVDWLDDLYLDDEKLYLAISTVEEDYLIQSVETEDASSLTIEEEMSKYAGDDHFFSDIIEGKGITTDAEPELYDIATGKSRKVKKGECWYSFFD